MTVLVSALGRTETLFVLSAVAPTVAFKATAPGGTLKIMAIPFEFVAVVEKVGRLGLVKSG